MVYLFLLLGCCDGLTFEQHVLGNVDPMRIHAVDINGDGAMDVGAISRFYNGGAMGGGFCHYMATPEAPPYFTTGTCRLEQPDTYGGHDLAYVDVNRDNITDVIVASYYETSSMTWHAGLPSPTNPFDYNPTSVPHAPSGNPYSVSAADLDGDGYGDFVQGIALASQCTLVLRKGPAFDIAYPVGTVTNVAFDQEIVDYDGDLLLDVIVLAYTSAVATPIYFHVFKNNGDDTFSELPAVQIFDHSKVRDFDFIDVNRDSIPDLVFCGVQNASFCLGPDYSTCTKLMARGPNDDCHAIEAVDFNKDCIMDFLVTFQSVGGGPFVCMGSPNGTHACEAVPGFREMTSSAAVLDANGDGWMDFVVGEEAASKDGLISLFVRTGVDELDPTATCDHCKTTYGEDANSNGCGCYGGTSGNKASFLKQSRCAPCGLAYTQESCTGECLASGEIPSGVNIGVLATLIETDDEVGVMSMGDTLLFSVPVTMLALTEESMVCSESELLDSNVRLITDFDEADPLYALSYTLEVSPKEGVELYGSATDFSCTMQSSIFDSCEAVIFLNVSVDVDTVSPTILVTGYSPDFAIIATVVTVQVTFSEIVLVNGFSLEGLLNTIQFPRGIEETFVFSGIMPENAPSNGCVSGVGLLFSADIEDLAGNTASVFDRLFCMDADTIAPTLEGVELDPSDGVLLAGNVVINLAFSEPVIIEGVCLVNSANDTGGDVLDFAVVHTFVYEITYGDPIVVRDAFPFECVFRDEGGNILVLNTTLAPSPRINPCHPTRDILTDVCRRCPAGTWAGLLNQACSPCPEGTEYKSITEVPLNAQPCVPCPEGGFCAGGGTPAIPDDGFAVDPNDENAYARCTPQERCLRGGDCRTGHRGDLCAFCQNGYYQETDLCKKCPSQAVLFLVILLLLMVIMCLVLIKIARKSTQYFMSLSVGFNFLQIVVVLGTFDLHWPAFLVAFFNSLSLINFNINLFQPECAFAGGDVPFFPIWMFRLTLPFFFLFIFMSMYALVFVYTHVRKRMNEIKRPWVTRFSLLSPSELLIFRNSIVNAYLTVIILLYLMLVTTMLEIFPCDPDTNMMISEPTTECGSALWRQYLVISIFAMLGYGLGIPLSFCAILYSKRADLFRETTIVKFGLLYRRYANEYYFYEVMVLSRKLGVVVGILLFRGIPIAQAVCALVALLVALIAQLRFQPYRSRRVNMLETIHLVCSVVIIFFGLILAASYKGTETAFVTFVGVLVIIIVVVNMILIVVVMMVEIRYRWKLRQAGVQSDFASDDLLVNTGFFDRGFQLILRERSLMGAGVHVVLTSKLDTTLLGECVNEMGVPLDRNAFSLLSNGKHHVLTCLFDTPSRYVLRIREDPSGDRYGNGEGSALRTRSALARFGDRVDMLLNGNREYFFELALNLERKPPHLVSLPMFGQQLHDWNGVVIHPRFRELSKVISIPFEICITGAAEVVVIMGEDAPARKIPGQPLKPGAHGTFSGECSFPSAGPATVWGLKLDDNGGTSEFQLLATYNVLTTNAGWHGDDTERDMIQSLFSTKGVEMGAVSADAASFVTTEQFLQYRGVVLSPSSSNVPSHTPISFSIKIPSATSMCVSASDPNDDQTKVMPMFKDDRGAFVCEGEFPPSTVYVWADIAVEADAKTIAGGGARLKHTGYLKMVEFVVMN